MKTIVLIGGIGSGKSTVARGFEKRGAARIDLDEVGHEVLLHDDVIKALVARFGEDILDEEGSVIRQMLAACAFADEAGTRDLNEITHPRLIADAQEMLRCFAENGRIATVVEISPYDGPQGEFGVFTRECDAVVAVVAPLEVRICRAAARGFDEADVRNRIARQVSDADRRSWADYVIENDGTVDQLQERIEDVWRGLGF